MEKKNGGGRPNWALVTAVTAVFLSLGTLAVMALLTLPSSDDFWYKYFLDGGIRHYLSLMKTHYLTFNGRVLVHVADHIVLHLGSWSFALSCVALLAAVPALLCAASGRGRGRCVWVLALFLPAVLSIPRSILNQGIFWTSAFFNYVLPTAMLTGEIFLFERALQKPRAGFLLSAACVVWSAACGATTEQSGIVAVAMGAYWLGKALYLRRGRVLSLLSLSAGAVGLASIFLSPATRLRFENFASVGGLGKTVTAMYRSMIPASGELCSSWLTGAALALFFLLSAGVIRKKTGKKWPGIVLFLPTAASVAVSFCPEKVRTALFVALCFAAAATAVALMASGEEAAGLSALAGLVSLAAILVTDSAFGRTLLPFLLTLMASDAVLLESLLQKRRALAIAVPVVLVAAGALAAVPFIKGMVYNWNIERENVENTRFAASTGELRYCIDYDLDYTGNKLYAAFMDDYLAGEGLPPDTRIRFYSNTRADVFAGEEPQYPVYVDGGDTLVWVRVIEAFGGRTVMRAGYSALTLELPWMECDMEVLSDGEAEISWSDAEGSHTRREKRLLTESRTWLPLRVYTDVLGFDVTYDAQRNAYIFTAPEQ